MSPGAYKAYSKHPEFCIHHHPLTLTVSITNWTASSLYLAFLPAIIRIVCYQVSFTLSAGKQFVHFFNVFSIFQVTPFFNGSLATQRTCQKSLFVKKEKLLPRTRMDSEGTLFSWENFPIQFSASPYSFLSR